MVVKWGHNKVGTRICFSKLVCFTAILSLCFVQVAGAGTKWDYDPYNGMIMLLKTLPPWLETGDSCLRVITKFIPEFADIPNPIAKVVYSTPETVQTLENRKKTIGYTTLIAIADTKLKVLKMLKIDGIETSVENVLNGKYRLTVPYAIVYKSEPKGLVKIFVDLISSENGREIISQTGAVPVE